MFSVKQKIVYSVKSFHHVIIPTSQKEVYTIARSIKMGAFAGQMAAWSIFGLILFVDASMRLPTGTFYSVIGVIFGLNGFSAMWLGFILHFVTGTVIGALFGYLTSTIKNFYITKPQKALALSIITGLVTWLVLFLPITMFVVQPSLEKVATTLGVPILTEMVPKILAGSIGMHLLYGGMLGFIYWLTIAASIYEYKRKMELNT